MPLFTQAQISKINAAAAKSNEVLKNPKAVKRTNNSELEEMSQKVIEYFKDSPAILITTPEELHDYIDKCIEAGYAGIDTETTGLDRINDHVVGWSLYYPGGVECYIPVQHKVPIFDTIRSGQLTYEQCAVELQRLVDNKVKLILANADFDIAMIYKDFGVDIIPAVYYDVILAWRVLKENEPDKRLKVLYAKYVMKLDPKKLPKSFSDFFTPQLFPYCKPEIAKLYAANDAKITYDLFVWQLPFATKTHPACKNNHLEKLSDILWGLEIPMIKTCAMMHRIGFYFDTNSSDKIRERYRNYYNIELRKMQDMVQKLIDEKDTPNNPHRPFRTGSVFNPDSPKDTQYLLYDLINLPIPQSGKNKGKKATGKDVIAEVNLPETNQLLKVRSLSTLMKSFTEKLPNIMAPDHRIHSTFNSIGADTGRLSSAAPNVENIPSHQEDIRHSFRADPALDDTKKLTCENNEYVIILSSMNQVFTDKGKSTFVKDLVVGDKIKISHTGGDEYCQLKSISNEHTELSTLYELVIAGNSEWSDVILPYKTSPCVIVGSDYSRQEPAITAYAAQDKSMIEAFQNNRDIYSAIASLSFGVPYEECLEFNPVTHAKQPEGKARRNSAKTILLGLTYGRSVRTISEQLYGKEGLSDEDMLKKGQHVYDSVMNAFPGLRQLMINSQAHARKYGYTETLMGRRRHIPEMQLPRFEFEPLSGYINPDIDPLDPSTLSNKDKIPQRIIQQLEKEYASFKYRGQIYKRNQQLYEQHIKVISNEKDIEDASRKCTNSIIQGSAADMSKCAMVKLINDAEYAKIGMKLIDPIHDELLTSVPEENAEAAGKVLTRCMLDAASFLPFKMSCDVEITYRWYGLPYKCKYTPATDPYTDDPEEIKYIQYYLFEMEYQLPVFKTADGKKPDGDLAKGINGIRTDEMNAAIEDYKAHWQVDNEHFIKDITDRAKGYINIYAIQNYTQEESNK